MFTLDEKFVGSLGIDYVGRKKITKNEWEHLQIKAGRIKRIYFFIFRKKLIHFFSYFLCK